MDHETNDERPSSKEGGEVKIGDKVWVLCEVIDTGNDSVRVKGGMGTTWWTYAEQCRPVEPANCPEIPDSSSDPMRDAFEAFIVKRYYPNRDYLGRNEVTELYFDDQTEMCWRSFQAGAGYRSRQIDKPDPAQCIGMQGTSMETPRLVGELALLVALNHWRSAEAKQPEPNQSSPLSQMDGVNVDDFVDGIMEEKCKTHGFKVGDTVRYICPGHSRHGTECTIHSISNAGVFFVLADKFHTYCSIAEIQHLSVAFVDPKNLMQLLAGTDTIQAGDLQWTDWDKKYRMCNFTIGMRVDQAIQRGKDNGQKWLFYRRIGGEAIEANNEPLNEPASVVVTKQYRTPTLADLTNGPIACECIGTQLDKWQPQILLEILSEAGYPYRASCPKNEYKITRWSQCRIEVERD